MDTSDDERLILLFIRKKRKQRRKKKRSIWCREHFVLRATCGEYIRTFRSLLDNRDEALFFNYTRMTYDTYKELLALVLPLLQPVGANWRQPITGEEKLILTLRIPQEYVLPHHLYDIFLVIIHPSQFTYRQKSEQAHFPASRLFTREAGNVRREVVWDIFEQNTSHHFSVHAGGGKWEVGSGKREALWSPSLRGAVHDDIVQGK
ncbi:hypothetical protein RRG08_056181 [Elysia crispata]|uniref:Uncharacterized protein n=1 Tax=Elysia crispata TaxID=231223 RepID=A0AAE1D818_9GAST|nr:hypothetical protein RRG08_056181 [Elysia crispata]